MTRLRILGFFLWGIASCDAPPPPGPETPAPAPEIPKGLCDETKAALEKLQGEPGLVPGEPAMIGQEAWLQMGAAAQTRVGQVLAVDAACRAEAPAAEQEVEIRSDTGAVLMKRSFDLSRLEAAYLALPK